MKRGEHHHHVCPVWVGYLLVSPLRMMFQNPRKILTPYVTDGMHVLDVGCAMGYFSLPMARLVGSRGRVTCVDLQPEMIASLRRRARRAGVEERIEARQCGLRSLDVADLADRIDFALAFAVVHEVPDASALFAELHMALKTGSRLLMVEPRGRISKSAFNTSIATAEAKGFSVAGFPSIPLCHAAVLEKQVERPAGT